MLKDELDGLVHDRDSPTGGAGISDPAARSIFYHADHEVSFLVWEMKKGSPVLSIFKGMQGGSSKRIAVTFEEGLDTAVHQHDYIELLYVAAGTFSQNIAGNDYVFRENEISFINHNVLHFDHLVQEDACVLFLNIPDTLFQQLFPENSHVRLANYLVSLLQNTSEYSHIHGAPKPLAADRKVNATARVLSAIIHEVMTTEPGAAYMIRGLLIRLMYELSMEYNFDLPAYMQKNERRLLFEEITRDIRHSCANITIRQLQEKYYFNRDYFNRLIREFSGLTFEMWRQNIRLEKAAQLLVETQESVEEIARSVGYENTAYFYRIFYARYQKTPMNYRAGEIKSHFS